MDAIEAVSRTVKTMSDGTLRLTVDISPIHAQAAFKLFGSPDVPMALARLTVEASKQRAQAETIEDKPRGGFLSQWLAMRCNEPEFWSFLDTHHEAKGWYGGIECAVDADDVVKDILKINSKTELDHDKEAEARFHDLIRLPYAKWLAGARIAA
jgi:hypothetical protein